MKSRFAKWLRRGPSRPARAGADLWLHSAERMQAILNRERLRCDRSDSFFSLLALSLASSRDSHLETLAAVLKDRIRITDDAGLLGPKQVGILLPETAAAGAWKLAEDIDRLLPSGFSRPKFEVFVHPSDGTSEQSEERRGQSQAEKEPRSKKRHRAQPMHVLFMQPLPLWKRGMDILVSSVALALCAPLMLLVALAVKLTSPGPVFFRQPREGLGGRRFHIYKFRSMVADAESSQADLRAKNEQDGPAFKLKNDPRVTAVGRVLRRTCIDELPQLFNVLRGDMSLVGPRPLPCAESEQCDQWARRRLDVTPGLTCTWQVSGGTKVTFAEWMRMDLRYTKARGLWKDVRLLLLTVPSIIRRDGVY